MVAQRRAAREAAWTAVRVPRIPLHQLLAAALGCAVPPLPDPSALPKRPPSASAFSGSLPGLCSYLRSRAWSYAAVMQAQESDSKMGAIRRQSSIAQCRFP